jgi:hypothetical protein
VYISGTGITPFTALLKPDFQVDTMLAINYVQLSNGNYTVIDRGTSVDKYEAVITIYGIATTLNNFIDQIEANRQAGSNVIALSQFSTTEYIFGENVNHSGTINATIVKMEKVRQGTWKGFGLTMRLRAISPAFTAAAAYLPALDKLLVGYTADGDLTINKPDSYTGVYTYQEADSDIGTFSGTFILNVSDVADLRQYYKTYRGAVSSISSIAGVTYPFGKRRGVAAPFSCRIKELREEGWFGVGYKLISLVLVEEV